MPTSTPSTFRSPTTCTCRGRFARRKRASTSSARSRSASARAEAAQLIAVRDRTGVQIEEAFMVRTHPQWLRALDIVRSGRIGPVRSIAGFFSYFNDDASNVRNMTTFGGGGLLDIGCYLVNTARMIFQEEPRRVCALIEEDPVLRVDRLSSMLLDFPGGHAIGTCSTQLAPSQSVSISGTRGRIEIEIPFNAPPDRPCRIAVEDGSNLGVPSREYDGDRDVRSVHHPGRPVFAGGARRGLPRPIRSKTRSATCASSTPCSARPAPTPGSPSKPVLPSRRQGGDRSERTCRGAAAGDLHSMPQTRFCSKCGASLAGGADHCPLCRAPVAARGCAPAGSSRSDGNPWVTIWLHPRDDDPRHSGPRRHVYGAADCRRGRHLAGARPAGPEERGRHALVPGDSAHGRRPRADRRHPGPLRRVRAGARHGAMDRRKRQREEIRAGIAWGSVPAVWGAVALDSGDCADRERPVYVGRSRRRSATACCSSAGLRC